MMTGIIQSMINSISNVPQVVQNSLDAIKDLTRDITLFGMDTTILVGYLLYIVLFFASIRGIYWLYQKYEENKVLLSKLFFFGGTGKKKP